MYSIAAVNGTGYSDSSINLSYWIYGHHKDKVYIYIIYSILGSLQILKFLKKNTRRLLYSALRLFGDRMSNPQHSVIRIDFCVRRPGPLRNLVLNKLRTFKRQSWTILFSRIIPHRIDGTARSDRFPWRTSHQILLHVNVFGCGCT